MVLTEVTNNYVSYSELKNRKNILRLGICDQMISM